jgi:lipid-A-disaccharide synthase-like uncharacterized protein
MILLRADHDQLIERFPEWMEANFPKLQKTWHLNGCTVEENAELREMLKLIRLDLSPSSKRS